MRIANNIMAMNTHRFYTGNNNAVSKSAEKLSSGYKINRAGDDAAGLAISEKMRAQIRGLSMAKKNSQDAVSMVQTAEGALQGIHSMLQRMNQLAVQSATGTNDLKAENGVDRAALQQEFKNLMDEIDQVAETTTFNNMRILAGKYGSANAVAAPTSFTSTIPGLEGGAGGNVTQGTATMKGDVTAPVAANSVKGTPSMTITKETLKAATDIAGGTSDATDGAYTAAVSGDGKSIEIKFNGNVIGSADIQALDDSVGQEIDFGALGKVTVDGDAAGNAVTGTDVAAMLNTALNSVTADYKAAAADDAGAADANFEADTANAKKAQTQDVTVAGTDFTQANIADVTAIKGTTITFGDISVDLSKLAINDNDATADVKTAIDAAIKAAVDTHNADGAKGTADFNKYENVSAAYDNGKITVTYDETPMKAKENTTPATGAGLKIQTGAEEGQMLSIKIDAMNTVGLGLALGTTDVTTGKTTRQADGKGEYNIGTQAGAAAAITATRNAINAVSTQRAELGAMQNRLEYKIDNLANTAENLSAAESRIRDVDIAEEMTQFTKNNILSQAATAMLAQANSLPQNVLSLLR